MITAEQFAEWKEHPVTKEIFEELKRVRNDIVEQIAYGNTIGSDAQATHGFTNKAVGQLEGLDQLLNISFADDKDEHIDVDGVSGY